MADYGVIYVFSFDSKNQVGFDIFISKKNYSGPRYQRALGGAPVLRRERNGSIAGTSLEILAECRTQGEFSSLYTSSADEYLVELYCQQDLMWKGFVCPELYSEPDRPAPYDVQIIATDGLGELKSHDFSPEDKLVNLRSCINQMLSHTGLSLELQVISSLKFDDDSGWSTASNIFDDLRVNLGYLNGESCYEVLSNILDSFNMIITQHVGKWYIIRENDLYDLANEIDVKAFGSMTKYEWWPIGNLSQEIIPAKKSIKVTRESAFKDNILNDGSWNTTGNTYYNDTEEAYILPGTNDSMTQRVSWFETYVRKRLALKIQAKCLSSADGEKNSRIAVRVKMTGGVAGINASEFYLIYGKPLGFDQYMPVWTSASGSLGNTITLAWDPPKIGDEAHEVQLILPFFMGGEGYYAYSYASIIEVTLYNANDIYPIAIYSCNLVQYDQPKGVEYSISLDNGAREKDNDIKVLFDSKGGYDGTPFIAQNSIVAGDGNITGWQTSSLQADSLIQLIAKDYAMAIAAPRYRYTGKLHVPASVWPNGLPILFERDDRLYLLNTYSYDLYNDELEVQLVSVPNASIEVEDMQESTIPATASAAQPRQTSVSKLSRTTESSADLTALARRVSDLEARLVQGLEIPAGMAIIFLDNYGDRHTISYDSDKNGFCVDGKVMAW